ncbi:MAG: FadR/GntR family transcriptional regulator [Aeromicrobium sp.]
MSSGSDFIRRPKAAELIAAELRRQIVRGELKADDALPSEAVLTGQFNTSRPTLREALRVLEMEGLITIRRGARGGARIQVPDPAAAARHAGLVLEYQGTRLSDVYSARSVIESECAGLAANRCEEADLDRFRDLHLGMRATNSAEESVRLQTEFEALVVASAQSETMSLLSAILRSIIDKTTLDSVKVLGDVDLTGAFDFTYESQRRLIVALKKRDSTLAARHWRRYLDSAQEFVLGREALVKPRLDLL